jgi:hypothetical protein
MFVPGRTTEKAGKHTDARTRMGIASCRYLPVPLPLDDSPSQVPRAMYLAAGSSSSSRLAALLLLGSNPHTHLVFLFPYQMPQLAGYPLDTIERDHMHIKVSEKCLSWAFELGVILHPASSI